MLFDSHNHLQSGKFGRPVGELVAEMKDAGITGCVVNATQENDWEAVAALAREFPGYVFPAYGIHPWYADTAAEGWEERLRERLLADPFASVGEVGVDGWVDSPGMDVQVPVFVKQAELAAELGRVMTVHCLKAWEPLFDAMDRAAAWPEKFLMHSFGGSWEMADRLLKKGAWFSFSGHFLHPRKAMAREVFRRLPAGRILLETDAPDMIAPEEFIPFPLAGGANHPANLAAIAEAYGRGMHEDVLARIAANGKKFWSASSIL